MWYAQLLFVGLFLLAGLLLSRAWRLGRHDHLHLVAGWSGTRLKQAARYKQAFVLINLLCGAAFFGLGVLILTIGLNFVLWASLAAAIFWLYFFSIQYLAWRDQQEQPD